MIPSHKTIALLALCTLSLGVCAADRDRAKPASGELRSIYQQERARCDDPAVEDKKACLREAGAAQAEARRGALGEENGEFEKNRMARCAWHSLREDREYCERRMRGEGTVSGSVQGGGILRELTVTVPAEEARK